MNYKTAKEKKQSRDIFLLRIFKYLMPYSVSFFFGLLVLVLGAGIISTLPYFLGEMLNVAMKKPSIWGDSINTIVFYIVIALCMQGLSSYFRVVLFTKVSENAMADLRHHLYGKIIRMPMMFFDKNRIGELVSRITSDIVLLQDLFSTTLAELIRQILTLLIALGFIFYISMPLSVFMLSILPVVVIFAGLFARIIRKYSRERQDELAQSNVVVEETFQSIQVVKTYTAERIEQDKYRKLLNRVVKIGITAAKYRGVFIAFIIIGLFGSVIAMVWKGVNMVSENELLVGDMMKFILFTAFIGGAIGGLANIVAQVNKGIGASERVFEILDSDTEINNTIERVEKYNFKETLTINDVCFSYPERPEVKVLNNINISINHGEKIAFVGHSGAGKSTLIQLLLRFYNLDSGEILLGKNPIYSLDLTAYRSSISLVPQEIMLFGGTIRENIVYGLPIANEEELNMAIEKANAQEFINKFPDKLETKVGERGVQLSGGQKQRVAIARAILKNPDLLILDEATSNLDAQSEKLIQEALENLMEGRTTIIIAHRLATIRKVDKIHVLQNGEIIEEGTHNELIKIKKGVYYNLIKLQLSE